MTLTAQAFGIVPRRWTSASLTRIGARATHENSCEVYAFGGGVSGATSTEAGTVTAVRGNSSCWAMAEAGRIVPATKVEPHDASDWQQFSCAGMSHGR
jgi:hypothetical protein